MRTKSLCSFENRKYKGWQAIYLNNGIVTLAVVPDIGGRVIAYNLGNYPFFFVDSELAGKLFSYEENLGDGTMAAWKNYGGDKTWPAPQGWDNECQWHGPPDPILDSGRYQVKQVKRFDNAVQVQMVSPPDLRTGIQITRQITLLQRGSRVILDLSFTNISKRQIRWSIWDVTQLRAERLHLDGSLGPETECVVTAPLNSRSRFPKGFNVMDGDNNNPQWGIDNQNRLFVGKYMWEIGKVGIDSPKGWIAFTNCAQGYAFAAQYTYFPEKEYPDQGATVECWTTGRGTVANLNYENNPIYLMEIEVLSPLYTFRPGETRSFQITWGSCRCEGMVVDVNKAGCIHQPLNTTPTSDGLFLSGSFGVFSCGVLQLVWQDQQGNPLGVEVLQEVSPLESVKLEQCFQPPPRAARVELQLLSNGNNSLQTLAKNTFLGS